MFWSLLVLSCSCAFYFMGWWGRDKWLRAEAVKVGAAKWVADEDGRPGFEWIVPEKEGAEES